MKRRNFNSLIERFLAGEIQYGSNGCAFPPATVFGSVPVKFTSGCVRACSRFFLRAREPASGGARNLHVYIYSVFCALSLQGFWTFVTNHAQALIRFFFFFFFNDTATTEIYTLSLHDALPISAVSRPATSPPACVIRSSSG